MASRCCLAAAALAWALPSALPKGVLDPPALAPDSRARFCRGTMRGLEVTVVAAREGFASVLLELDDPADSPLDVELDALEPLELAGGRGSGGR